MGSEWVHSLRSFVSLQRGTTYKGSLVGLPGPVLLGLASIEPNGGFRYGGFKTYGGDCPEKISLRSGDLYVSLKDVTQSGDLLGSISRIPADIPSGRLTQDTVKLVFDGLPISKEYLYWLLRTPEYRDYCRGCATGTTTLGLARDDFLDYPIPAPSAADLLLVELFEGIEKRITLLHETNATLEAIAQALFKSWFVDFDPVRAKMEVRDPEGMDEATAALFPSELVESELGLIPKGWASGSVDQDFHLTMGQSPPGSTYNELGNGLPFYQGRSDFTFKFPNRRIFCTAPTRYANAQDTLISVRAPVGDVNMALEKCAIGRGVAAARHQSGSRSYTYYFMQSIKGVFNHFEAEGTVFGSISKKDFHAIKCVIPKTEIVSEFENIVSKIDSLIECFEIQTRGLIEIRDTLLPKLISGQLRIPEVEEVIESIL